MGVRAITPVTQLDADDLINLEDRILAMHVVLTGVFKDRLEDLRNTRKEIIVRQGTIDTVEKSTQLKLEADLYSSNVKRDADNMMQRALTLKEESLTRLNEATAKEKYITVDLVERERIVTLGLKQVNELEQSLLNKFSVKDSDLSKREKELIDAQMKLSKDISEFKAQKDNFQSKVDAIMDKK